MYLQFTFLALYYFEIVHGCIPTQQVDTSGSSSGGAGRPGSSGTTAVTTTTVATTTTTVTEPPFPCNNCPKIYDNTCQGFGIPNWYQWCPTAAEAGIEYTLGFLTTIFPLIPAGSCGTIITCPLTTSLRIKLFNQELPAPVFYAWCPESGTDVGKWFTGAFFFPFELVSLACKPILG